MSENFGSFLSYSDQPAGSSSSSSAYIEAVNGARFVKGFGITALVYALAMIFGITFLGGGIGVGVGLFVFRYDSGAFYRYLGIAMLVLAVAGLIVPFGIFLGPLVLSTAVLLKGVGILKLLSKEGREDDDWVVTRKRALIGSASSGIGLLITIQLLIVAIIFTLIP